MAIATHRALVAERLVDRHAERDADVLDGMMGVDGEIAIGLDVEIDDAVACDLVEHVIQKRDSGGEGGHAAAVEIDGDRDLRFLGIARDASGAGVHRLKIR